MIADLRKLPTTFLDSTRMQKIHRVKQDKKDWIICNASKQRFQIFQVYQILRVRYEDGLMLSYTIPNTSKTVSPIERHTNQSSVFNMVFFDNAVPELQPAMVQMASA